MIRDLIKKILFVFGTFILVSSCKFFSADLKGFLEYYSGSAGVGDVKYPETVGVASNGKVCIDSKTDKTFNLLLRNPQGYKNDGSGINIKYEFNNSELNENTWYPEINLNEDLITATMTFSKENLEKLEKGAVKDDDNNLIKDLSGVCRIYSNFSSSYFEGEYPVNFMVNSAPERIRGAMFQLTDKKATVPNYVVAFNAPVIAGTVHEADTHHIYIGKNHWTFTKDITSLTPVYVEEGCSLSKTKPSALYDLDDKASTFTPLPSSEGYVPLYFTSNEIMDDSSRVVTYKLSIIDDYGLSTNTVISNKPNKLQPPDFTTINANSLNKGESEEKDGIAYPADEESEEFKFVINHEGKTFYIDENGEPQAGATCTNPIMIQYVVKQNGTVVQKGIKQAPVTLSLKSAVDYTVEAYAYSDGIIDSVNADTKKFGVSRSNIYYVDAGAPAGGTGSKTKPYKTVGECFDTIRQQFTNFKSRGPFVINLMSDISNTGDSVVALGSVNSNLLNTEVIIQGYNGVKKITCFNVEEDDLNNAVSMCDLPDMTIKLKDLEITSEYGIGIYVNSGSIVNLELENVTIKDCVSYNDTAGIEYNSPGKLTLSNTVVTNNQSIHSVVKGAGIFANQGEIHLKNKVVISNNYDSGNQASNLYLRKDDSNQTKVIIDGPLSAESRIGVTTQQKAIVGTEVIFTQGYYTHNSRISPSSIFQSDDNFGVCWESPTDNRGEASLVKSGSLMLTEFYKDVVIEFTPDLTYANGIKLVPALKLGELVNGETVYTAVDSDLVTWSIEVSVSGEDFTSLCTISSNGTIIIPNTVIKEKYSFYIQIVYDGKYYPVTKYIDARNPIYLKTTDSVPVGTVLKVSTGAELEAITKIIGVGSNPSLEGVKIQLEKEIDLSSITNWTPIGNSTYPFKGTFDGKNFQISGMYDLVGDEKGLFGVTKNAVIRNVIVTGSYSSTTDYNGGLVGKMKGGLIENCINKVSVTCMRKSYTGGIAGCVEDGAVILNCGNEEKITGHTYTGGIAGSVGANCKIISCYNEAIVDKGQDNSSLRGGITGFNDGEIINCYARHSIPIQISSTEGDPISTKTAGIAGSNSGVVKNCVAAVLFDASGSSLRSNNVANVVGENNGTVENCFFIKQGARPKIVCGLGQPTVALGGTSPIGQADEVTGNNENASIVKEHQVGSTTSNNPIELLNAFVTLHSDEYELKRWKYVGSPIKIIFED